MALDSQCIGYIPMFLREFRPALAEAVRIAPGKRFIDVGCGLGTKLLLAQRSGLQAFGVEIRPRFSACARSIAPGAIIWTADVRELQIRWDQFDIIFVYSPLERPDETVLEEHIVAGMHPKAILFLAYGTPPGDLHKVGEHLWAH